MASAKVCLFITLNKAGKTGFNEQTGLETALLGSLHKDDDKGCKHATKQWAYEQKHHAHAFHILTHFFAVLALTTRIGL